MDQKINVLFVCMGNICRSPMAEGIFRHLVSLKGLAGHVSCDSAGINDYHEGDLPDPRMRATAKKFGLTLTHRSRPLAKGDFDIFDYILGMDDNNLVGIGRVATTIGKEPKADVLKMRQFDNTKSSKDVEDPYYQPDSGFTDCYQVLEESCRNFLDFLIEKHQLGFNPS